MKQNDKVLMTSDKTWISKEEWDFHKEHTAKLEKEWMEHFFLSDKGVQIREAKIKIIGVSHEEE